jgi:hypothetical protein
VKTTALELEHVCRGNVVRNEHERILACEIAGGLRQLGAISAEASQGSDHALDDLLQIGLPIAAGTRPPSRRTAAPRLPIG